ncbi:MAG TPA: HypC/HybG/HupF family hydrogenase formation chaperone [Gammaproteobacteria bacterium]|nr:HypC/HybG/HupF family hydrogenase formation chaperone [Gammaproteobacteria bacterium]
MCIGIPMQVVEMRGTYALCEADGKQELVDMILVGEQAKDTWILNFLGGAREVLTPEYAEQVRLALTAMEDIAGGNNQIDHLFSDLLNREPELPAHLQAQVGKTKTG